MIQLHCYGLEAQGKTKLAQSFNKYAKIVLIFTLGWEWIFQACHWQITNSWYLIYSQQMHTINQCWFINSKQIKPLGLQLPRNPSKSLHISKALGIYSWLLGLNLFKCLPNYHWSCYCLLGEKVDRQPMLHNSQKLLSKWEYQKAWKWVKVTNWYKLEEYVVFVSKHRSIIDKAGRNFQAHLTEVL
jgi:hypothetical protein